MAGAWEERVGANFAVRCGEADLGAADGVLDALEAAREAFAARLGAVPAERVEVVLHGTRVQLHLAQPTLLAVPPEARPVVVGRAAGHGVHLLSPRLHGDDRAAPALYARLAVLAASPPLLGSRVRRARFAWLVEGAAQWLAGRTPLLRPAIARRLREAGTPPAFPPGPRDALLFGPPAVELIAREHGDARVLDLLAAPGPVPDGLREVWERELQRLATAARRGR